MVETCDDAPQERPAVVEPQPLPIIAVDIEDPRMDYPVFMDSFAKDPESSLDIDVPKTFRSNSLRRLSITSVSATGPPSVSDRLHEELFPVCPLPPTSFPSNAMVKGRFQISLVKATEKIYQSVQSVLSPTNSNPLPGSQTPESPSQSPDGRSLMNSWKTTFRRGSKDTPQVELIHATSVVEKKDDQHNGDLAKHSSPEKADPAN